MIDLETINIGIEYWNKNKNNKNKKYCHKYIMWKVWRYKVYSHILIRRRIYDALAKRKSKDEGSDVQNIPKNI